MAPSTSGRGGSGSADRRVEAGEEVARAGGTLAWVGAEGPQEGLVPAAAILSEQGGGRCRSPGEDGGRNRAARAGEGVLSREHLVRDHRERPHVPGRLRRPALQLLGGHVGES